jgi:hypothetical protein
VVFVTGDTLTTALREFVDESGRPVIEKPFLPSEVRRVVAELVALTPRAHAVTARNGRRISPTAVGHGSVIIGLDVVHRVLSMQRSRPSPRSMVILYFRRLRAPVGRDCRRLDRRP